MKHVVLLVLIGVLLTRCSTRQESVVDAQGSDTTTLRYAKGFTLSKLAEYTMVEVLYPYQGATSGYKYLLVPRGQTPPQNLAADTKIVFTPVTKIVCTSTTHIPLLDYLNETDKLIGFPTTDYISSAAMRKRINAGLVTELGVDKGMDLEKLAAIKPDLVMGYTMTGDYGQYGKMEDIGISVVLNGEYLERHPLGRAEWIKFMALFFNKQKMADSVFNAIEKNYLQAKALADGVLSRPTVMSGIMYGDGWFLPGGQNYAARLMEDAGFSYIWREDSTHGFLQKSFEAVYERARNSDFWIGTGQFNTLAALEAGDTRYAKFAPFKNKKVYTYDARRGEKGGSEFLELGYLRPDLILQDLVKIGQPDKLPGYELYFHKRLE